MGRFYVKLVMLLRKINKMPEAPTNTTGSPIKEFIEQAKGQVKDGLGDWELKAPIDLELSTIVKGKVGGGIDIQVIQFGARVEAEQQQKIKISIGPKDEAEQEEKKRE